MTRTTYKRIPFDLELAKKIMNKEVKGRIVTRNGRQVRIVSFDRKATDWNIVALVSDCAILESITTYNYKGKYKGAENDELDLLIEIPIHYRDYSNFEPQEWQPCVVRDFPFEKWKAAVCCGKNTDGFLTFYSISFNTSIHCRFAHYLPLSKITERLIGTTKSYEELIQELDENERMH